MTQEQSAAATPARARVTGQLGWVSYEMAGGPYFNIVKIFVFAPYFASVVVGDTLKGQEYWGYIDGASGLFIALSAAIFGSTADAFGPRKPLMALFTALVVGGLFLLWLAAPGTKALPIAAVLVATAVIAELAMLYHNSLLAFVAPPHRIGLISGLGYSANYLATLVVFALWLMWFGLAETPALGLDRAQGEDARVIGPLSGLWFLLFAVPFFLYTPDAARRGPGLIQSVAIGISRLLETLGHARHYANIMRYLVVRMIYFDGLVATFSFVGIYAAGIFEWTPVEVGVYGAIIFSVMVFAGVGGGLIDDRIGSKRTIVIGIAAVMVSILLAIGTGATHLFFIVELDEHANAAGLPFVRSLFAPAGFTRTTEQAFILFGMLGGVFMGPALASSRTLLARLAPHAMMAEFFGLYTLTGKATAFLAPIAIAVTTRLSESQRTGMSVVLIFLVIGIVGLLTVKEERAEARH